MDGVSSHHQIGYSVMCNSCRDYGNTMNRLQTINWTERSIQRSQWSTYWGMPSSTPKTNPRQKEICQRIVSQLLLSDRLKITNRRSTRRLLFDIEVIFLLSFATYEVLAFYDNNLVTRTEYFKNNSCCYNTIHVRLMQSRIC